VEPMLEREPHPEVGGQTQRSNHLGGPDLLGGLRYGLPHLENRSLPRESETQEAVPKWDRPTGFSHTYPRTPADFSRTLYGNGI
jgi:hypothetical protein